MDNYNNIKDSASNARQAPPEQLWQRVTDKLDHQEKLVYKEKRDRLTFLTSIAACLLLVFGCWLMYQEAHSIPDISVGQVAQWEDLDLESDHFYNVTKLHLLNEAYKSSGI